MRVVVDTSIWVAYLRHGREGNGQLLDELLERDEVLACGPVVAELLAGARVGDKAQLWELFAGLPWADLDRVHWRIIGEAAAALRAQGAQLPLTDLTIAVVATQAGAAVWSQDSDFDRMGMALPAFRRFEA